MDKEQKFIFLKEYKTSSVDFGSYTNNLLNFYNYFEEKNPNIFTRYKSKEIEVPKNKGNTIEKISEAIIEAIKLAFPQEYKDSFIIFANQNKYNFDLKNLINELYDKHNIKSVKLSLSEIGQKVKRDEEGNLLFDKKKVSLVYFNCGDKEEDYPDEDSWKGREVVE